MSDSTAPTGEWRLVSDISGFEAFVGYRVSRDGRVESCRSYRGGLTDRWRELRPSRAGRYVHTILNCNGVRRTSMVHHLVLLAFGPPRPPGQQARHKDGDRQNNHIDNLCWGTAKQNSEDRDRHGRTARGERQGGAKLTTEEVKKILRLHAAGRSGLSISAEIGVSSNTIYRIINGESWKHVR